MRNVMVTETAGDVFNGSMARTVSNKKKPRDGEEQVDRGFRGPFGEAAEESWGRSDGEGQQYGDGGCGRGQQHRHSRALQQSRKAIATQVIGAQPVFGRRAGIHLVAVLDRVIESRKEAAAHTGEY